MDEIARQNKVAYNQERNKQLRADGIIKDFRAVLNAKEANEINEYIKSLGMNKADFVRWAYKKLKEENIK